MSPLVDSNYPPSNFTRLGGALKVLGGIGETLAGSGLAVGTSWSGIGAVAGGSIAAHGLDSTYSGVRQAISGLEEKTFTAKTLAEISGSENFGEIADAGVGFFGSIGSALAQAFKGFAKISVPAQWTSKVWRFGELPNGVLGSTDAAGNIIIQNGLKGAELQHVIDHEMVHRFFSPADNIFQKIRGRLGTSAYANSQLLRFTEEALAEGYATNSIRQGVMHPLINGYDINGKGLAAEAAVAAGIFSNAGHFGGTLAND